METKMFESFPLNSLEFEHRTLGRMPLPDELPAPPQTSHLPREILQSATVENLISQNEELMARLKVSLRRLSSLESENQKLSQAAEESRHRADGIEDQVSVLRERDGVWKEKVSDLETKAQTLEEKLKYYSEKAKTLEQQLSHHIEHSQIYQERIKTQVKPHLIQLKEYARSLEEKLKEAEAGVARREAQIRDLREQMIDVTKNAKYQVEQAEIRQIQTVESYEKSLREQRDKLIHTAERLDVFQQSEAHIQKMLEETTLRLRRAEQSSVEFENEVVELRRHREELMARTEAESRRLSSRTEELASENVRLKMENEDLRGKVLYDYDRIAQLEKANIEQKSQLESLRFLYNSRMEELEKIKLAFQALERLNVDLSSRVQELRPPAQL